MTGQRRDMHHSNTRADGNGRWEIARPLRAGWWQQRKRERACRRTVGHCWHSDGFIGWWCCECSGEVDGMPPQRCVLCRASGPPPGQPAASMPPDAAARAAFPTDDTTLDLLWTAINPGPEAERSSLYDLLELLSEMRHGKSGPGYEENGVQVCEVPRWSPHDVICALIVELRRVRPAEHPGVRP